MGADHEYKEGQGVEAGEDGQDEASSGQELVGGAQPSGDQEGAGDKEQDKGADLVRKDCPRNLFGRIGEVPTGDLKHFKSQEGSPAGDLNNTDDDLGEHRCPVAQPWSYWEFVGLAMGRCRESRHRGQLLPGWCL